VLSRSGVGSTAGGWRRLNVVARRAVLADPQVSLDLRVNCSWMRHQPVTPVSSGSSERRRGSLGGCAPPLPAEYLHLPVPSTAGSQGNQAGPWNRGGRPPRLDGCSNILHTHGHRAAAVRLPCKSPPKWPYKTRRANIRNVAKCIHRQANQGDSRGS